MRITPIPAFSDNYIWIIESNDTTNAWVVDPGDATPVVDYLHSNGLTLAGILITHHHWDHTSGINALRQEWPCQVYGPKTLQQATDSVSEGDTVTIFGNRFKVMETPGHTLDHICFYAKSTDDAPILFCGDTLFRGGCGRMMEGTPEQFHASLQKLAALPDTTRMYCTHEYTMANYRFAIAINPNNVALQNSHREAKSLRQNDQTTLPGQLGEEKQTNPFMRVNDEEVISFAAQRLGEKVQQESAQRFAQIRRAKDTFS